jgi:hypothetical protein
MNMERKGTSESLVGLAFIGALTGFVSISSLYIDIASEVLYT